MFPLCLVRRPQPPGGVFVPVETRQSWADRLITRYFDALTAERAGVEAAAALCATPGNRVGEEGDTAGGGNDGGGKEEDEGERPRAASRL